MPTDSRPLRWRAAVAVAAGLLGAGAAATAFAAASGSPSPVQLAGTTEDVSGPCDEAEHAADPECTGDPSTTVDRDDDGVDGSTSTTIGGSASPTAPDGTSKTIDAAPAGTVVVEVQGGRLVLVSATPNAGWRLGEQETEANEVEVRFLSGTQRVDVNAELEDGQIRARVRVRALDGGGTSTTVGSEDRSGPGGGDDLDDDHSGPGGGDEVDDDHSGSGHDDGSGDDAGDDHGGDDDSSGSGRDHPEDD